MKHGLQTDCARFISVAIKKRAGWKQRTRRLIEAGDRDLRGGNFFPAFAVRAHKRDEGSVRIVSEVNTVNGCNC